MSKYRFGELTHNMYRASLDARNLLAHVQSAPAMSERAKQKLVRAERYERQFRRGQRHA